MLTLYTVITGDDGHPQLEPAREEDIAAAFRDPFREALQQEAENQRKLAREYELQAHKLHEAVAHLRRFVRQAHQSEIPLEAVVNMIDRTRGNIIAQEALGGGFQVTPMPDNPVPEHIAHRAGPSKS